MELGPGSSLYINGYRTGMLLASGGGLILADIIPFSAVYAIMALCMIPGMITTVMAREPVITSYSIHYTKLYDYDKTGNLCRCRR